MRHLLDTCIRASLLGAMIAPVVALAEPPPASPAVTPDMIAHGSDIPAHWNEPKTGFDYVEREVMIPMRDGVALHTVIVVPNGAHDLPMLMERTPYNAGEFIDGNKPHMRDAVWRADREWADDGYILVFQDIRGKYGSKGDYVMTRPPMGPLNASKTDDTTDSWDTVDWLVKHVPESNGRVGLIGSSYDGWTVAMALLGPHPAVKVAAPESPMIDGWMGDDWFHYGAFRQVNLDYFTDQESKSGKGEDVPRFGANDYRNFLDATSAGAWADAAGFRQLGFWNRLSANPAYDAFWQDQALDRLLAAKPSTVPTMWLQGLWDQEDMWGAVHSFEALTVHGGNPNNHLVMGPWFHSQVNGSDYALGPLKWNGDQSALFRADVLIPWFDSFLKDRKPAYVLPKAMIYNPVENHWDDFRAWPGTTTLTPLYLGADGGLGFAEPASGEDSYVSDPAKPVPFLTPPVAFSDEKRWQTWLVQDQRAVGTRTDVLSFQSPVLTGSVTVEGAPIADIFAKTTGTDGDFVVKVIDVYPPTVAQEPELGGYELPISMDIFRGRYRKSFSQPSAIPANQVQEYRFRLPTVNWVFKPGHRMMVQVQSTLFPLYDRNPQTWVDNIFFAKPADYRRATISIEHGLGGASAVLLPVVGASTATH